MKYERKIKVAFDKISGEYLEAEQVFDDKKDGFLIRKKFHKNDIELYCCECEQQLNVSTSKYDNLHFKHQPNAKYCLLKDSLTAEELEEFNLIFKSKESQRHKDLKNKIGNSLKQVNGIEISSIAIDNKIILRNNGKKKPDVYCKYLDKELVFEIQLSNLSLKYILSRYEFYRENGIYLIWILDNFNVQDQTQLVRDIKYLSDYHNFFKFNEAAIEFNLTCTYKKPFITEDLDLRTKWQIQNVKLDNIKFDPLNFQVYFYNLENEKNLTQEKLLALKKDRLAKKLAAELEKEKTQSMVKIEKLITDIKFYKDKGWNLYKFHDIISKLNDREVELLNYKLGFKTKTVKGLYILNHYIKETTVYNRAFIDFLIKEEKILLDFNQPSLNNISSLQELMNNECLNFIYPLLTPYFFKRGYHLLESDINYLNGRDDVSEMEKESKILILNYYQKNKRKNLSRLIFKHQRLLFDIESIKQEKIIDSSIKSWVQFAVATTSKHRTQWQYMELAFEKYGLLNKVIEKDKKGTFLRKIEEIKRIPQDQDKNLELVLKDIFTELF
ncbi:MAG TPA: DUF6035 family protein [Ignavibacteriaceae bacterium]|nr:DUF6035 family protein [uncultured Pedobacter sp.]